MSVAYTTIPPEDPRKSSTFFGYKRAHQAFSRLTGAIFQDGLRRLARFAKAFPDLANMSVLDIGGRPMLWELLDSYYRLRPARLVLLNNEAEVGKADDYETVVGDGCHLGYEDKYFDLVFSNSVIEHVGDMDRMRRFANECARVGKEIYIQTPNRWFPIEPHTVTLFLHWFPKRVFRQFGFLTTVWWINGPDDYYSTSNDFKMLSRKQFREIIPNGQLWVERFLGLSKSFVISTRPL